jgi:transcriptional regulator GlxA family with amidase domain
MDVNVLLFDDFETLDAFGPVEVFGCVESWRLRFVSVMGGMIRSSQGVSVSTESLADVHLSGILLIPGGQGTRILINDSMFIKRLAVLASQAEYCLTVCTGAALLAKTNLLNGRNATSNKRAFAWVQSVNSDVIWISRARWVDDGKFYTSSGISAGIDMALGFIGDRFGQEKALEIAQRMEYIWHQNQNEDVFGK